MMEQPWSVIEGSAMAATGAMLLGWGRARYATLLLPLMIGYPAQQRAAADVYETVATALRDHPGVVEAAIKDVRWTAPSAELYKGSVQAYADDAADKAASPQASAHTLRVTADVYDVLGKAVFLTGAGILTAGVMHRVAQVNPFTRVAAEVAATAFGRRADVQAGALAARARAFVEGGKGLLAKAAQKLAQASPATKALVGGGVLMTGGTMAQQAVAGDFAGTKLASTPSPADVTGPPRPTTGGAGLAGAERTM